MKIVLFVAVFVVVLTGCSAPTTPGESSKLPQNTPQGQSAEKLSVVASFYPLVYMAERIGGENVSVINVVGASDPHDYTLSPRDIKTMQDADVVLLQGAGFEPWAEDLERQLAAAGTSHVVIAEGLTLAPRAEDEQDEHAGEKHRDEHGEDEDMKDDEADDDAHGHGAFDPHTWLDPVLAQDMAQIVLASFVAADATNADMFRTNAAALSRDFAALDSAYADALSECAQSDVIVSHDAFGYLANRYSFTTHAIAGISTQDEPSAKTLALLKAEAAEGITHILAEETSVNRFAQTLSRETSLTMLPINALASPAVDGADFFDRARTNLTQIQTALGCSV